MWVALWSAQILQQTENFHKSSKKDYACVIDIEDMALGFLRNCQEVDMDRFRMLLYLSLSYLVAEILLVIGIDVVGRKIFLGKRIIVLYYT